MNTQKTPPSELFQALLREIEPGSILASASPLRVDGTHPMYVLEARSAAGNLVKFVVKCYRTDFGPVDIRARREFKTLQQLQRYEVPTPVPILVDEAGKIFGTPTLVTEHVRGEQLLTSSDGLAHARELAKTLVRIHSVSCDMTDQQYLLDAHQAYLWFMEPGVIPGYMIRHPDGQVVWDRVTQLLRTEAVVAPALVHIDYWMGNVLWDQGKIVAVVDWEEAGYGDPGYDVAYCRMDMYLSRMGRLAADELLNVYESEMGRRVANLDLWEYAVTPRPMKDPDWESSCHQELRDFIAQISLRSRPPL